MFGTGGVYLKFIYCKDSGNIRGNRTKNNDKRSEAKIPEKDGKSYERIGHTRGNGHRKKRWTSLSEVSSVALTCVENLDLPVKKERLERQEILFMPMQRTHPLLSYYSRGSISAFQLSHSRLFLLFFFCSFIVAFSQASSASENKTGICPSMDIRNNVASFNVLENCTVVEGFVQIVLMDRTNDSDFANLTFPKLREITGYLLIYRVNGLHTLSKLFPNLAVIRGQELFMNYALAVYEILHIQELGLISLTDISRGSVFISKNPLLCFIETINWSKIVHTGKDLNLIFDNRPPALCPRCSPVTDDESCLIANQTKHGIIPFCWNANNCQKACKNCPNGVCAPNGECCSETCLGGCHGPGSNQCHTCRNVILEEGNQCVETCPGDYYMFKERRCVTADECWDMPPPKGETAILVSNPWMPFNGVCYLECPDKHEAVKIENSERYKCGLCSGICRKVCSAAIIDSIQAAQKLKGCVVINGSLEIQIRGTAGNIAKELEDNLYTIQEITGYFKVVRSLSLMSLNFMRNLKLIRGERLENHKYSLIILDNENLVSLWDWKTRYVGFEISRGRLFFHFNPKLCLNVIRELQDKIGMHDVLETEVAQNSNGDKIACVIQALNATTTSVTHESAVINWLPYTHYEMRTLLGYFLYLMETTNENVTVNDGRNICGGDLWKVYDIEPTDKNSPMKYEIHHLKPYQLYAYYIATYTIASEEHGGQSKILYFRTLPAIPSSPRTLKPTVLSSSEVYLKWEPPELPNGNITTYFISVEIMERHFDNERNYCSSPIVEILETKDDKSLSETSTATPTNGCDCSAKDWNYYFTKNDEEVQSLIDFENTLHDTIYVKTLGLMKNKRSINEGSKPHTQLVSDENSDEDEKTKRRRNKESKGYKIQVPSNQLNYTLTNLTHFTDYTIGVYVCRETIENETEPENCGSEKTATLQTKALETADKIDAKTIRVEMVNDTNSLNLSWDIPTLTNGPILTFTIRYKRMDIEHQTPAILCVTMEEYLSNGKIYKLENLPSGNYSLEVKVSTLAQAIHHTYTPPIYFLVKESAISVMNQLLLGSLCAIIVVFAVVVSVLVGLRYFYPDSWYNRKYLFATVNPEYFTPIEGYDKWEISRRKVVFENVLGVGHFGEVYEGRVKGLLRKGVWTKVAIKTLSKVSYGHRSWTSFLNEASVMKQFDTHHVVRLLAVVTKGEPLVIMELMAKGDLRTYLRSCRNDSTEEERKGPLLPAPSLKETLQMAAEIADGMLYLADKKFVHRDLAARNCMINSEGTVKIGDFGLTRDVYETDYYRKDSKGHLPVRWMAPESLRDGIFTIRSDIWSYGIVLWEMTTLAALPYTGLGNGEVMPYVISGGSMDIPRDCPILLGTIMKLCWQYNYTQRPSFHEICKMLEGHTSAEFKSVAYFHSEDAKLARLQNLNGNGNGKRKQLDSSSGCNDSMITIRDAFSKMRTDEAETMNHYVPLRLIADFEDFTIESDEGEEENDKEARNSTIRIRSIPSTHNGYIRKSKMMDIITSENKVSVTH